MRAILRFLVVAVVVEVGTVWRDERGEIKDEERCSEPQSNFNAKDRRFPELPYLAVSDRPRVIIICPMRSLHLTTTIQRHRNI